MGLKALREQWRDVTPLLLFVCAYASLGAVSQGFDTAWWGFILGATAFNNHYGSIVTVNADGSISKTLSTTDQSISTGLSVAFGMIGGLAISVPMKYWGRRNSQYVIGTALVIGIIIEAISTIPASLTVLIVGKCFISLGTGLASGSICVYLSECAPASVRGAAITVYTNVNTVGSLVGAGTVYAVVFRNDAGNWLYPICLQAIFPVVLLAGTPWLPESPRWLVARGRVDEAEAVLRKLRNWTDEQVHAEVTQIAFAHEEEIRISGEYSYLDLFRGSNRRRTLVSLGCQMLQQAQGLAYIISYMVLTLIQMGFTKGQLINLLVYVIMFICSFPPFYTSDRIGRRPLLMIGSIVCAVCMLVVAAITTYQPQPKGKLGDTAVAMYLVWIFSFASTWIPIIWMVGSEVPAQGLRDKTLSASVWCGYSIAMIVVMGAPYVSGADYGNIGAKISYIWAFMSVVSCLWVYYCVPELKGRSLEEIDYMFQAGLAVRDFAKWDSTALLEAKREAAAKEGFNNNEIAAAALGFHEGHSVAVGDHEKEIAFHIEDNGNKAGGDRALS